MKRKLKILLSMAKHPVYTWELRHVTRSLKKIGIDIYDENGDMKTLLDVLKETSEKWADVEARMINNE